MDIVAGSLLAKTDPVTLQHFVLGHTPNAVFYMSECQRAEILGNILMKKTSSVYMCTCELTVEEVTELEGAVTLRTCLHSKIDFCRTLILWSNSFMLRVFGFSCQRFTKCRLHGQWLSIVCAQLD